MPESLDRSCQHDPAPLVVLTLLNDIVGCSSVSEASGDHACAAIVRFQSDSFPNGTWQPPTPWVGHLGLAPLLFLGSNPNIGGGEYYPDEAWSSNEVEDFFDAAFDGHTGQISGGNKARQSDGEFGNAVKTWSGVRRRAEELLLKEAEPGVDYAMSEIVHCRSGFETGVDAARNHCADRFLERTLDASAAKVVVALGAHNRRWLTDRFGLGDGLVHELGEKLLVFLPHPTSWGSKTFAKVLSEKELGRLQDLLA